MTSRPAYLYRGCGWLYLHRCGGSVDSVVEGEIQIGKSKSLLDSISWGEISR